MTRATLSLTTLLLTATAFAGVAQAEDEFPYDGVVRSPAVEVRSGPGQAYYATGTLSAGDRVRVVRHDRGGWSMIEPPAGSFSYIRVDSVRSADERTGVVDVTPNDDGSPGRVVVRIGSQLGDDSAMSARNLPTGERVVILGRKFVTTDAGEVEMYKIEPPAREYRWVKGDFIAKATAADARPAAAPLVAEMTPPPTDSEFIPASAEPKQLNPDTNLLLAQRKELEALDGRFRAMVGTDPTAWRLDELEADYQALSATAATDILVGQIGQRLAAIESRRKVLREFEDFHALITKTSEREQRLLSLQAAAGASAAESSGAEVLSASMGRETPSPQPLKLDGAGLVQKVRARVPGGPKYVLLAPDGRTLAYLVPEAGVSLDEHVGQSRGIVGDRRFSETLGGDVIDVTRLVPAKLQSASLPTP